MSQTREPESENGNAAQIDKPVEDGAGDQQHSNREAPKAMPESLESKKSVGSLKSLIAKKPSASHGDNDAPESEEPEINKKVAAPPDPQPVQPDPAASSWNLEAAPPKITNQFDDLEEDEFALEPADFGETNEFDDDDSESSTAPSQAVANVNWWETPNEANEVPWVPAESASISADLEPEGKAGDEARDEQLRGLFSEDGTPPQTNAAGIITHSQLATVDEKGAQAAGFTSTAETESFKGTALIGQTLADTYQVMDIQGEGQQCMVYVSMSLKTDEIVAVKALKSDNLQLRQRFKAAVMLQGKLKHENIVKSLAYVETSAGKPFFLQEFVEGVSLEDILLSVERIDDEKTIASILLQLCAALECAHNQGVVHGRLTAKQIILIDSDGLINVKVTDFAIADLKNIDLVSPRGAYDKKYLSPERLSGGVPSAQADIYSLATIAFRIACGRYPYELQSSKGLPGTAPVALSGVRPDLLCVHQLEHVLHEALDANPERRTDSIAHFKEGILSWFDAAQKAQIEGVQGQVVLEPDAEPQIEQPILPITEEEPLVTVSNDAADEITEKPPRRNQNIRATISQMSAHKMAEDVQSTASSDSDSAQEGASKIKKRLQKRRKRKMIRSTSDKLMELRHHLFDQEQTLVVQFTAAAAGSSPRRSPVSTMARLVALIVVCLVVGIFSSTYIFTHHDELEQFWINASRQLSMLLPGAKHQDLLVDGAGNTNKGPKRPIPVVKKKAAKATSSLPAKPMIVSPPASSTQYSPQASPSFGVTNNWRPTNGTSNKRRIEYREFKPR